MIKELIVIGCGGQAKVVVDLVEQLHSFQIIGFFDDYKIEPEFMGYPVLGKVEDIKKYNGIYYGGIVAIGDNWSRKKIVRRIQEMDPKFRYVTLCHPEAIVSQRAEIGEGTAVMAGAVVNTDVKVGHHCIINTLGSVAHDCVVGDYASVGPGAHLGGHVQIGEHSAISIGARVLHGITIGQDTIIGAGATVTHHITDRVIAYGVPAKVIRSREKDEPYL
ncbi:acetyltransferase [Jeotgalibacillus salarius]|uniref:acetyltransferase n=1 Tax=Jeotgalibacillus salarius TaxID=546023 RepID=UPI00141B446F|nr:acetyltransferase [Jeotgalibacillus salarius]